jgi:predicted outer membrane repeat protein
VASTIANFVGLKIQNGVIASGINGGSGIANFAETVNVIGCTIKNNVAFAQLGGGILSLNGNLKVVASRVIQNELYNEGTYAAGGGIASVEDASLKIIGTKISDNFVTNVADTAAPDVALGGGVAILFTVNVKIKSCNITGNIADSWTLDQYASSGAGLYMNQVFNANIINTRIAYNMTTGAGGFGGGVFAINSNATFNGCSITENSATGVSLGVGGGLYLERVAAAPNMTITISNLSSVTDNFATTNGGGIYATGDLILDVSADSFVAKNSPDDFNP